MYLIVGLGNPEEEYSKTRHNMGFNTINKIAKEYNIEVNKKKFDALYGEVEIQNILAHYKRLGKDEDKYVESFNRIASQYNDVQLRIITKFLPLNVRAVLEEKSEKYQQIISFNSKISDNLRAQSIVKRKEEDASRRSIENDTPSHSFFAGNS